MFRTLSLGDSLSVALSKPLKGGRGEVRLYTTLQQRKQAVWTSEVSLWAHWIHFFLMHLSYLAPILFSCSPCFWRSPSSSAITVEGGQHRWIIVFGTLIHIWRPEIIDDCSTAYCLIWKETFSLHSAHLKQYTADVIQNFSSEWTTNTAPSAIKAQSINSMVASLL